METFMTQFSFNAHFISEIAILLVWALLPYYTYITFKESGHGIAKSVGVALVILLWGGWAFGVVKYEIDGGLLGWLPIAPLKLLFYLLLAVGTTTLLRKRLVGKGLSQHWLLGLQTIRLIGFVFIVEYFRGNLPAIFAFPAGLGDMLTAIIAIAVLVRYRGKAIPRSAILLVFTVGMIDFASAIFFGITSSETLLQLFAFNTPNQVTLYPTGLIPFYGVPFAIVFHLLSFFELQRATATAANVDLTSKPSIAIESA